MQTLTVVKHLDVIEQLGVGAGPGWERLVQLALERAEEALGDGVVVAVGFAVHAAHDTVPVQQLLEVATGVLAAAV